MIDRFWLSVSQSDLVTLSPCQLVTLSSAASAATSAFGETIIRVLAIVGGAVVGGLFIGMLAQVLIKFTTRKPAPRFVKNVVRLLGAVAVGLAVYLFVFGPGGGGLGGFGWGLGGSGSGTTGHSGTTQTGLEGTPRERPQTTSARPSERERVLAIEMLGGARVKDNRFYLAEGEKEPATLEEVRKTLEKRLQSRPPLKAIDIIISEDSVSERDPAVSKLRQLAEQLNLDVYVKTPAAEKR